MACLDAPFDATTAPRLLRCTLLSARTLQAARLLLIALLPIAYPLALILPGSWGWENQVFENAQVVVLLAGFAGASFFSFNGRQPIARLGLVAMPFWAIAAARELSWGAVFLPPLEMTADGPVFSSKMLWYEAAVHPLLALLLGFSVLVFLRFRLDRAVAKLWRDKRLPWLELGLIVVAALISTVAEGHTRIDFGIAYSQKEVLEELMELIAYSALFLAQARAFKALTE